MEVMMNQIVESLLAELTPGWALNQGIRNAGGGTVPQPPDNDVPMPGPGPGWPPEIDEPEPDRLPDEEPKPNPDENSEPPIRTG